MNPQPSLITLGILCWLQIASAQAPTAAASPSPTIWRNLTTDMAASVTQGWLKTRTDCSIGGGPLRIAGKRFEKGLGTHPPGEMVFNLDGKHHRFMAKAGWTTPEGQPARLCSRFS